MTSNPPDPIPDPPAAAADNRPVWTAEQIRGLGAATDLPTAAAIFGLGRTQAYQLAKDGLFPVPVLRIGKLYRIPIAPILALLQISDGPET